MLSCMLYDIARTAEMPFLKKTELKFAEGLASATADMQAFNITQSMW